MIVATAGHVDHGKTLLVKALTGVDTDRLPEEKKRGMTIDLGFAYLPVESAESIGFIDVPGHARFIHNMLSGVAGIDFVLMVVAADDGCMPQTLEHLSIVDLLGVRQGAVALTKIDRVDPARISDVQAEIETLLNGTSLRAATFFPVSAITGQGIDRLKNHLLNAARECRMRNARGNFRLAIDRSFTVAGAGLVVTGTAVSGSIRAGDQVRILPEEVSARVRTIHAQNQPVEAGRAGQRCALNLSGTDLKRDLLSRGDWIVTGSVPGPVSKIDARLRILSSEQRPLEHWTPVHVHLGAADVTGRVAVLEGTRIAPGADALVQLVLDRPLGALCGDGFIVRDQSAQRTIGGGRVIDIFPPARGRAKPERLAYLAAMEDEDEYAALMSLLESAPSGLNLSRFAANRNLTPSEADQLFARSAAKQIGSRAGILGFSPARWQALKAVALETLAEWHRRAPNAMGPAEDRLFSQTGIRLPAEVAVAVLAELVREGTVVKEALGVRLPSHKPKLSPEDALLWNRVAPLIDGNPFRPPTVHDIATAVREDPKKIESFLVRVQRLGTLVRLTPIRFFRPEALQRLGKIISEIAAENDERLVTAAQLRDRTQIGRTVAIEILEFFDRIKFTRRVGDAHQLVERAASAAATGDERSLK